MSALGEQTKKIHKELGKYLETLNLDNLYTLGEYTKYFGESKNRKQFETIEELMIFLDKEIKNGDLIYVKASNAQQFNKIVNHIKQKYEVK